MLKNKPLKIIIDTNLWISFIISAKLNSLDDLLFSERIRILFSNELITEIHQTMMKPKLKKFFSADSFEEMLSVFEPFIELVKVKSIVTDCKDPNDNFLLALAKDGKADYLLSGDKHLLELQTFGKTKIMKITNFLNEMKK